MLSRFTFPALLNGMAFEDNTLLFGADPAPRIVAIELGETGTVKSIAGKKTAAPWWTWNRFIPLFGRMAISPISGSRTRRNSPVT